MPSLEPDLEDVPNRVSLHTDPGPGYAKRYRTLLEASGGARRDLQNGGHPRSVPARRC